MGPNFFKLLLIILLSGQTIVMAQTEGQDADPIRIDARVEPYSLTPGESAELIVNMELPKGFRAYADQFKFAILEPQPLLHGEFKVNPLIEFFDKFSKKQKIGMLEQATMRIPFKAPEKTDTEEIKFALTYQACTDSFCLFPKTRISQARFRWESAPQETIGTKNSGQPRGFWSGDTVKKALGDNLAIAFFLVFIGGILTSFTPCIFPMIPITLAILGHDAEKRSRRQNFFLSVFYVHGIATTYSFLGLIAATSGQLFGANLGHPLVLGAMCAIFFLMALSMYGFFEIQVPSILRQSLGRHKTGVTYFGAYLSGIVAGVVASPCVGPVLVTLLAFVASTQDRILGFFLLFTYAMGLGVIFLILGAFTELIRKLPRSGHWMEGMKFLLGSLMLGAFFYYLSFLIPQRWHDGTLGIALIVIASFYGAFMKINNGHKLRRIQKGLMQATLAVGIGYILISSFDLRPALTGRFAGPYDIKVDTSSWNTYSAELVTKAKSEGRPVVIDFFADWCLACHELDRYTFSKPEVIEGLKNYERLRFDATKDSPELEDLKKRFKIMGLPTVVFLNSKGEWIESETLTQFEKSDQFIKRLNRLDSL